MVSRRGEAVLDAETPQVCHYATRDDSEELRFVVPDMLLPVLRGWHRGRRESRHNRRVGSNGMRLAEIFLALEPEGLHDALQVWFRRSSESLRGRIAAVHLARELQIEQWVDTSFGIALCRRIAQTVARCSRAYDADEIATAACSDAPSLECQGSPVRDVDECRHVIRLKHLLGSLGLSPPRKHAASDSYYVRVLKRRLRAAQPKVGRETAWLTHETARLTQCQDAREVCDLLGMPFRAEKRYVELSLEDTGDKSRPTVYDGDLGRQFSPCCDGDGWGCTVVACTFVAGNPEAVVKAGKRTAKLVRLFLPSKVVRPRDKPKELSKYLDRELTQLEDDDLPAREDLDKAWTMSDKWW